LSIRETAGTNATSKHDPDRDKGRIEINVTVGCCYRFDFVIL
jgi:hypothetical protein